MSAVITQYWRGGGKRRSSIPEPGHKVLRRPEMIKTLPAIAGTVSKSIGPMLTGLRNASRSTSAEGARRSAASPPTAVGQAGSRTNAPVPAYLAILPGGSKVR